MAWFVIGAVCIAIAYWVSRTLRIPKDCIRVKGVVVGQDYHRNEDGASWAAVVEYVVDGKTQTVTSHLGSKKTGLGELRTVGIDPTDSAELKIDEASAATFVIGFVWLSAALFLVLGVIALL